MSDPQSRRRVRETSFIPAANILSGHIVSAACNPFAHSLNIAFGAVETNVCQANDEAAAASQTHGFKNAATGESRLYSETPPIVQVLTSPLDHFSGSGNGGTLEVFRIDPLCDGPS